MLRNTFVFILGLLSILISSCLIRPPEVLEPWADVLNFASVTPFKNMRSTATELHLITDDAFMRVDQNGTLLERRPIPLPFKFFGRPILGNLAIARVLRKSAQGNPLVELRSTKNPDQVIDIDFTTLDDLPDTPVMDNIFPEENSRYSGVFNEQSTQLLIPAINFSNNGHTFFLLKLTYDLSGNGIDTFEVEHVVHIPAIPAASDVIDNIQFIGGNYYVVTLDGSFLIRQDGSFKRIFQGHFWDFFPAENRIFATERSRLLHFSTDGGENWQTEQDSSALMQIEIANNEIFSHQAIGFKFELGTNDFGNPEEIVLNPEFPEDFAAYRNIAYLNGFYYLTVQKRLFRSREILIAE